MAECLVNILLPKLTSFIDDVAQFREEIISMKEELERISAFLRVADYLEETDEEVRVWVKQIQDIAYDIEDALDEFRLLLGHDHAVEATGVISGMFYKISCCIKNFKARSRVACKIQKISARIKSVCEGHERLSNKVIQAEQGRFSDGNRDENWHDRRVYRFLQDETDLVGIEEPKEQLVEWLLKEGCNMKVISVVGMGGLGKTTLAKRVFEDPNVKKHFAVSVWITLSRSFNIDVVLKEFLRQIMRMVDKPFLPGTDTSSMNRIELMVNIRDMLQTRQYLVVIDDVWDIRDWNMVKYVLPCNYSSRVVITTRDTKIAGIAEKEFKGELLHLKPLTMEQSWELFCRKTFLRGSCPSHLEDICKSIVSKCEGLPLAIVDISGVLATKDEHHINEWDAVRRTLGEELYGNHRLEDLKNVISLSFKDLPYYLKSCFLLLSVFPEGRKIRKNRLIRLWIAEGLVEKKNGKTREEVAEDYFSELLCRSLLQAVETRSDGRVMTCRIHTFLWEIINSKSRGQRFAVNVLSEGDDWPERTRRLSIHYTSLSKVNGQSRLFSQLRSLYAFEVKKPFRISVVAGEFKLLGVLDLEGAPLKKFPLQIVDCYYLTYLSLRQTGVTVIPASIAKLSNLQTLELKHTNVSMLPPEVLKLQNLCHLLVYQYEQNRDLMFFKHGFKGLSGIGALKSLQKLCYIEADIGEDMIKELRELSQLTRLGIIKLRKQDGKHMCSVIAKLGNLQALSLTALDNEILDLEHLTSPPKFLQRVYLSGMLESLPQWVVCLQGLSILHLRWSNFKYNPLMSLQNLPNLVQLDLVDVYNGELLYFKAKGFKRLRTLKLQDFKHLQHLVFDEGATPSLEDMFINKCKLLNELPSGIEFLSKLKVLEFFNMSNEFIKNLTGDKQEEHRQKISHVPEVYYGFSKDRIRDVQSLRRSASEVCTTSKV